MYDYKKHFELGKIQIQSEKKLKTLSDLKYKSVELYRSVDPKHTRKAFNDISEGMITEKDYIYLLIFDFKVYRNRTHYIKYPNTEHFVELTGGTGSSGGGMGSGHLQDVWNPALNVNITFKKQDTSLLLEFGRIMPDFNFLELIGRSTESEWKFKDSSFPPNIGKKNLAKALKQKYIILPEDIRYICHMNKTKGDDPTFIVVDRSEFNYWDSPVNFRTITNNVVKSWEVVNHQVYRDGGTTYYYVKDDNGVEKTFFSPAFFRSGNSKKEATWDDKEIVNISKEEKANLVDFLKIQENPTKEFFEYERTRDKT